MSDIDFVARLARTLLGWSYEGTTRIEGTLRRVAAVYGREFDGTVMADAAVLTLDGQTVVVTRRPDLPGLDQVGETRDLVEDVVRNAPDSAVANARLEAIMRMPHRYGTALRVLGVILFSIGFSLSIQATWQELVFASLGSLFVALVVIFGADRPRLMLVAPLVVSLAVSTIVLAVYDRGWIQGGPIQLMVPVLFYFIPGDVLTAAMLELADGRWTAGVARLAYGAWTLGQLAFGALLAALLTHTSTDTIFDVTVANTFPRWVVWLGWAAFTVGVMLVFSMRPRDFPWALATVLITFGAVQLGTAAFGEVPGTFVGACAMTLTVILFARKPGRPALYVLGLGAFFVLTPGSRGLRGLETWLNGVTITGADDLLKMAGMLVAIVAGIFVVAAMVPRHWLSSAPRP